MYKKIVIGLVVIFVALVVYLFYPTSINMNENYQEFAPIDYEITEAVMIINTGSPQLLDKKSVQQFIGDMLSDKYVLGMPNVFRNVLARKIIAPLRASSSLAKYRLIWGDSLASPLMLMTRDLVVDIENRVNVPTALVMRYGNPSTKNELNKLLSQYPNLKKVVLLPLFPHYAESSYLTAVEEVRDAFDNSSIELKVIEPFFDNPHYIDLLVKTIEVNTPKGFDKLIFSFHSLPNSHVEKGKKLGKEYDYEYQCSETARLAARHLGLESKQYEVVYASAMGRNWLGPDLHERINELPSEGCAKVAVVAPGFIIDNLETFYDIDIVAKETFLSSGGVDFTYIPCFNSSFAEVGENLLKGYLKD